MKQIETNTKTPRAGEVLGAEIDIVFDDDTVRAVELWHFSGVHLAPGEEIFATLPVNGNITLRLVGK